MRGCQMSGCLLWPDTDCPSDAVAADDSSQVVTDQRIQTLLRWMLAAEGIDNVDCIPERVV